MYNKLYQVLKKLKEDGKSSHTVETLAIAFSEGYPIISSSESSSLVNTLQEISKITVESGEADGLLAKLKERQIAQELAISAASVAAGESNLSTFLTTVSEVDYEYESVELKDDEFVSDNIVEIQNRFISEPPFNFRLRTLNQVLGGLRRRTFGFLYARPEIGKTQLLASEGTFLAAQVPSCILWINNEEDGTALITRCYQAALCRSADAILKNSEKAREEYSKLIQGKLKIYDKPNAKARDIENIIRTVKPDIIFIDQLDKVRGFEEFKERYDLLQKAKYQWARELAKSYNCAVLGICQAGGTAENKRYLDMNDVDSSHTAKQGEADWMVGMGATDKIGEENDRFLSFTKNKLPPSPQMIPEMRHAKIRIKSIPEIQHYEDVIHVSR